MTNKLLKVKGASKGNRVALAERHPDHPEGEVFIYGQRSAWVAATKAVKTAIARGLLELDTDDDEPEVAVEPPVTSDKEKSEEAEAASRATEVAPDPETKVSDGEDFSVVDGIGERTTEALHELGIKSKQDLLTLGVGDGMARVLSLPGMTKAKYAALMEWASAA